MSKQWIRKATLLIGAGDDIVDLSNLHFTFETTGLTLESLGTLQARIYNPAQSTIKKILDEGTQVFLSAGYVESFGQIFSGNIIQLRAGRENATDTYLDISATDGDDVYNDTFVNTTVEAGTNKSARLQLIAKAGKFSISDESKDDGSKLPRGKVFFGLARDHIRPLCANLGADWHIKDGSVNVISRTDYKKGNEIVLSYDTGLIGFPVQTFEGVTMTALLNFNIVPGVKVVIDNSNVQQFQADLGQNGSASNLLIPQISIDGAYKVLYVSHSGDTRGQKWYSDIIGISGDEITNKAQSKYAINLPAIY